MDEVEGQEHLISQPYGCQLLLKEKPWDVREVVSYKKLRSCL